MLRGRGRRHPVTEPDAYVHRVMVNVLISRSRLRRFREEVTADVPEVRSPDPTSQHADRDVVWRALQETAPRQRAVLVLRFYEGMTESEIATCPGHHRRHGAQSDRERTRAATGTRRGDDQDGGPAMTDDMEERLREVLRDRAGVPVMTGNPVAAVQDRMRRRSRRRGIAVGSTAALCVAGIAIAATALAGNDTSTRPIGPAVNSSSPPTAAPKETPTTTPPASSAATSVASSPPSSAASAVVASASSASTTPLPVNVSSLSLPAAYTFFDLSTDAGPLLLTGAVTSADENAPCIRTSVDASALTLGAVTTGACNDPKLSGERAAIDVINPDGGSAAFTTSIAITVTDPKTGKPKTGPVVMRISEASDTNRSWPTAATRCGSMTSIRATGPRPFKSRQCRGKLRMWFVHPSSTDPSWSRTATGSGSATQTRARRLPALCSRGIRVSQRDDGGVKRNGRGRLDGRRQRPCVGWHPPRWWHFYEPLALRRAECDSRVAHARADFGGRPLTSSSATSRTGCG